MLIIDITSENMNFGTFDNMRPHNSPTYSTRFFNMFKTPTGRFYKQFKLPLVSSFTVVVPFNKTRMYPHKHSISLIRPTEDVWEVMKDLGETFLRVLLNETTVHLKIKIVFILNYLFISIFPRLYQIQRIFNRQLSQSPCHPFFIPSYFESQKSKKKII